MRKLIAALFVSLAGIAEAPEKGNLPYFTDEMGAVIGRPWGPPIHF